MIWLFVILFIVSFLMGILNVPLSIFLPVVIFIVFIYLFRTLYISLFEKNENKILTFLRKSKLAQYQFLYHLYNGNIVLADKLLHSIRSKQLKTISTILLLSKQKKYKEAKELLPQLKDNLYKWYYSAGIALQLNDQDNYLKYKARIKHPIYLTWLEIEEKFLAGKKTEALEILEEQIPKLRGINRLSAIQYKKEIGEE